MQTINRIALFMMLVAGVSSCTSRSVPTQGSYPPSFHTLISDTDWIVALKDFSLSLQAGDKAFTLRVQGQKSLRYSVQLPDDFEKGESGPLQKEYAPQLAGLFAAALAFADIPKTGEFTLHVRWDEYPKSILKWAQIWQASELKQTWAKRSVEARTKDLMALISQCVVQDMQPVLSELGFLAVAADMEKMSFQKAGELKFYNPLLSQAGIPATLDIPIPMMLYIMVGLRQPAEATDKPLSQPQSRVTMDDLFAVAQKNDTTLYVSFHRALDEYEINGDVKQTDGTFLPLVPIARPEHQSIAGKLFQAAVVAAGDEKRSPLSLRINLRHYPQLEQEVIERFALSPELSQKISFPRPALPNLKFHAYEPLPASGFIESIRPFLKTNGYAFDSLQINMDAKIRAGDHPVYAQSLKLGGIKPNDSVSAPSMVYLIIKKK